MRELIPIFFLVAAASTSSAYLSAALLIIGIATLVPRKTYSKIYLKISKGGTNG